MKALTIIQPWASLIADGTKWIETRSWPTAYCGPLAIHAGQKLDKTACERFKFEPAPSERGAIIAVADLYNCVQFPNELVAPDDYGDFTDGRWGWLLRDVYRVVPIPMRGSLGLWHVDESLLTVLDDAPLDLLHGRTA